MATGNESSRKIDVAIIGTGFGGIGAALRLKKAGEESFLVFEKASEPGGTWRDNAYPGCTCDVPGMLYWYSLDYVPIDEQPDWTHVYPRQAEILRNFKALIERRGLREHIRVNSEIVEAVWTGDCWHLRDVSGAVFEARMLVSATGQLSRPVTPAFPDRERFAGVSLHSACWKPDVVLAGKRVALIGSGATAIQIAPAILPEVASLGLFQRTPNYILPRMDREYTSDERTYFRDEKIRRHSRGICNEFQEALFRAFTRSGTRGEAGSVVASARQHLESLVPDPVLRERVWPDFHFGCKRPLFSDDFYPTLLDGKVELVTSGISRLDEGGIWTNDEQHHPADVIIYATGFETQSFVGTMRIQGTEQTLGEAWQEFPETFMGTTVSGFPNLFMLYGPNTGLSHNSVIMMIEAQIDYFLECKQALEDRKLKIVDVRPEAMAASQKQMRDKLAELVWSDEVMTWYKNASGDVTTQWTGTVEDYVRQLRLDLESVVMR